VKETLAITIKHVIITSFNLIRILYRKVKILSNLIEHETLKGMFYVQYDDGVRSADYYNYTRAFDHLSKIKLSEERKKREKARQSSLEARGCV